MASKSSPFPALPLELPLSSLPSLYRTHGHLVLQGIPPGSVLTLDGVTLSISSTDAVAGAEGSAKGFQGFKLIPPGWHSLTLGPNSGGGIGAMQDALALRSNFVFRVLGRDVHTRRWDNVSSSLLPVTASDTPGHSDVLTEGAIASLDRDLAPYPLRAAQYSDWTAFAKPFDRDGELTSSIAEGMLGPSFTVDVLDPVSGGALEDQRRGKRRREGTNQEKELEESLLQASAKRFSAESVTGSIGETASQKDRDIASASDFNTIHLANFSLLRSWPEGAVASDRTRWSKDKSRALHKAIESLRSSMSRLEEDDAQRGRGKACEAFLVSFHLLFHLCVSLGSEDLLKAWGNYTSLVCQSASAVGSHGGAFEAHPSEADSISLSQVSSSNNDDEGDKFLQPGLHSGFLDLIRLQLHSLGREWFADVGGEEIKLALLSNLKTLRGHISRAMALDALRKERGSMAKQPWEGRNQIEDDEEDEEQEGGSTPVVIRSSRSSSRRGRGATQMSSFSTSSSSLSLRQPAPTYRSSSSPSFQDFESLLSSWRSLSVLVKAELGWKLDEQTDEEVEVMEELDEEYQDAVRRALEEMPPEDLQDELAGSTSSEDEGLLANDEEDAAA